MSLSLSRRHHLSKKVPVEKYLQRFDILINSTGIGTLGRVGQLFEMNELMTVDSHIRICRPNPGICSPIYLGQKMKSIEPMLQTMTEGSTGQAELSSEVLNLKIICPPIGQQMEFESKVLAWMNMILRNEKEIEHLTHTRDYLLPRLLSGGIELETSEEQVQEVLR